MASSASVSGSDLFAIRPVPKAWGGKPGEVNIIAKDRPMGCARFLSAFANSCGDVSLTLVGQDDSSGLQRWVVKEIQAPVVTGARASW